MIEATHIAIAIIGIMAFLILFYGPWQTLCADSCRQDIFEIRDRLFDRAADGQIEFSSSEYVQLRDAFNLLIRFAHTATPDRFLLCLLFGHSAEGERVDLDLVIEKIQNISLRMEARTMLDDLAVSYAKMMILRSLFFGPLIVMGLFFAVLGTLGLGLHKTNKMFLPTLMEQASLLPRSSALAIS